MVDFLPPSPGYLGFPRVSVVCCRRVYDVVGAVKGTRASWGTGGPTGRPAGAEIREAARVCSSADVWAAEMLLAPINSSPVYNICDSRASPHLCNRPTPLSPRPIEIAISLRQSCAN